MNSIGFQGSPTFVYYVETTMMLHYELVVFRTTAQRCTPPPPTRAHRSQQLLPGMDALLCGSSISISRSSVHVDTIGIE
jgi:hypothetical protein